MRDHRGQSVPKQRFKWRLIAQQAPSGFAAQARRAYLVRAVAWGVVSALAYFAAHMASSELLRLISMVQDWTRPSGSGTTTAIIARMTIAIALTYPFAVAVVLGMYLLVVRQTWASLIAAYGRCPACGYKIMNIEPAADGLTVCPECGGAWRCRAAA